MANQVRSIPQNQRHPAILKMADGDPFLRHIKELYETLNRSAYRLFEKRGRHHGRALQDWLEAESELLKAMPLEVNEADGDLIVRAEVPGFHEKDIEVRVGPHRLVISGRKEASQDQFKQKTIYSERRSNEILRMLDLGLEIDPDGVEATLENGTLQITLRKTDSGKKVPVTVRAA